MNQHLVSKVLLKEWANHKNGPVSFLNLESLVIDTNSTDDLGSVIELTSKDAEKLERAWSDEIEKRLNHPLELVKAGAILEPKNKQHLDYLKDCMALHWARSFTMLSILQSMIPQYSKRVADDVLETFSASVAVHGLTGIYVPSQLAEQVFRDKISEKFELMVKESFLSEQFDTHFNQARQRMATYTLEICHAGASEFVLSDCPVVTWDKNRDIAGVLFGAAWNDATSIFMAVGPKHIVVLAEKPSYRELNEAEVIAVNKLQVRAAFKEIFFRDGCDVGTKIAEALRESK